jgi:methylmalonyl-CoA mutase N-terminal domain/subunit
MSDLDQTPSGIPVRAVYGPQDRTAEPPPPGQFPFTRGNFATGYRGRLWTFRQYSGFGTPEESNQRYRYLLDQGGTGLSVALDLPTQCGYDSDDPEVTEEVGRVGVAIDTLADAEILFDAIPLDKISTSFTINGTAAILLAFYVAAAEKRGIPRAKLTGTIQNDILKEYASRGTWFVEALTDATEERVKAIMDDLDSRGGMVRAIEDGYLQGLIADEAYRAHQAIETGAKLVVGVNRFASADDPAPDLATYELDPDGRDRQLARLAKVKAERDAAAVAAALTALARAARAQEANLMPPLIDCANAYCTVGEMVSALKDVWGEFQQPVVF